MVWKQTQRTATNPCPIQVWFGSGPTLGHCFAYDAVRSEQPLYTTTLHFRRDEVDGTGEPRLLAGSSEASKASISVEQNHKAGCMVTKITYIGTWTFSKYRNTT